VLNSRTPSLEKQNLRNFCGLCTLCSVVSFMVLMIVVEVLECMYPQLQPEAIQKLMQEEQAMQQAADVAAAAAQSSADAAARAERKQKLKEKVTSGLVAGALVTAWAAGDHSKKASEGGSTGAVASVASPGNPAPTKSPELGKAEVELEAARKVLAGAVGEESVAQHSEEVKRLETLVSQLQAKDAAAQAAAPVQAPPTGATAASGAANANAGAAAEAPVVGGTGGTASVEGGAGPETAVSTAAESTHAAVPESTHAAVPEPTGAPAATTTGTAVPEPTGAPAATTTGTAAPEPTGAAGAGTVVSAAAESPGAADAAHIFLGTSRVTKLVLRRAARTGRARGGTKRWRLVEKPSTSGRLRGSRSVARRGGAGSHRRVTRSFVERVVVGCAAGARRAKRALFSVMSSSHNRGLCSPVGIGGCAFLGVAVLSVLDWFPAEYFCISWGRQSAQ